MHYRFLKLFVLYVFFVGITVREITVSQLGGLAAEWLAC